MTLPICEKLVWLANGLDRSVHPDASAASEAAVLIGELYEALAALVEEIMDDDPCAAFGIAKHAGQAALAKARGEQP